MPVSHSIWLDQTVTTFIRRTTRAFIVLKHLFFLYSQRLVTVFSRFNICLYSSRNQVCQTPILDKRFKKRFTGWRKLPAFNPVFKSVLLWLLSRSLKTVFYTHLASSWHLLFLRLFSCGTFWQFLRLCISTVWSHYLIFACLQYVKLL